jgi:hypothetical protein
MIRTTLNIIVASTAHSTEAEPGICHLSVIRVHFEVFGMHTSSGIVSQGGGSQGRPGVQP